MEWSNELVIEFLELYESEPSIWHPKHPDHRDRTTVHDAWKRIEKKMTVTHPVRQLKKKKESLMATFRKLSNKAKVSGRGDEAVSWFAYSTMARFLHGIYKPRRTTGGMDDLIDNSVVEIYQHSIKEEHQDAIKHEYVGVDADCEHVILPEEMPATTLPNLHAKIFTRKAGDKRKRSALQGVKKRLAVGPPDPRRAHSETPPRDDCSLYAELLTRKLRALNEKTREIVMNDIDNLVFRAKMGRSCQPVQHAMQPCDSYPSAAEHAYGSVPSGSQPSPLGSSCTEASPESSPN